MANIDVDQDASAGPDTGAPPPMPGAGGGPPSPQGGGPILAALARRQAGPQVSAPGQGDNAQSMNMLSQAIGLIQQALPGLPPGTPPTLPLCALPSNSVVMSPKVRRPLACSKLN